MRIHIIACRVLMRELSYYASQSENTVEITWLPQGLHNTPAKLRQRVKQAIAEIYEQGKDTDHYRMPDYIVLGYGLCSNGVVGVESGDIPMVVPKTDDCIALFLGSQRRYIKLFEKYNGTYWLNAGWVDFAGIPTKKRIDAKFQKYCEQYGEENAEFLVEQDRLWLENYNTCAFISSDVFHSEVYPDMARAIAEENGWEFAQFEGDNRMLRALCEGTWNDKEFLICPPHHIIEAAYDGSKIRAVPIPQ